MKKQITYLLGAGASAYALPTVASMASRMQYFFELVKIARVKIGDTIGDYDFSRNEDYQKFLNDIRLTGTPDTVIRIGAIAGIEWNNLNRFFLAAYMIFEQLEQCKDVDERLFAPEEELDVWTSLSARDGHTELPRYHDIVLDRRYVEFLSSVIDPKDGGPKLPENLSIVTWNYDHQIEKALKMFEDSNINSIQKKHNVMPRTDVDDTDWDSAQIQREYGNSRIIKLNGTAGFVPDSNYSLFDLTIDKKEKRIWRKILNLLYSISMPGARPQKLMFAWDTQYNIVNECRTKTQKLIGESDVVVVIGYSFPNFNRQIDRQIFEKFEGANIYIQDINPEEIIQKLDGVKSGLKDKAIPVKSSGAFTLPNEFWE